MRCRCSLPSFEVLITVFLLMNDTMISFVIWILGLILAVKAAQEIWKLNVDTVKKVLAICFSTNYKLVGFSLLLLLWKG